MMVQLNLLEPLEFTTLGDLVRSLSDRWAVRLGDATHAVEAGRITRARFAEWESAPLNAGERRRICAYYRAVLRRRVLRMSDEAATRARRRMAASAIEADLIDAGWEKARAAAEVRRIVGATEAYSEVA